MTDKIMTAAHKLGDLIKNEPETAALNAALDAYERDDGLNALVGEYNAAQQAIMSADDETREKLNARLEELYGEITEHPVYVEYMRAKSAFDALYSEAMGEIEFAITGEHPCTHDCSTCGGCH